MGYDIYTPTAEEVNARIGRFKELRPMSTADDLAWVPQKAWGGFFRSDYQGRHSRGHSEPLR